MNEIRKQIEDLLNGTNEPQGELEKHLVEKFSGFQAELRKLTPQIEQFKRNLEEASKRQVVLIEFCGQYYSDIEKVLSEKSDKSANEQVQKSDQKPTMIKAANDKK